MDTTVEFDEEFQSSIVRFICTNPEFLSMTEGLVKPSMFETDAHRIVASYVIGYWKKYGKKGIPSRRTLSQILNAAVSNKIIDDLQAKEAMEAYDEAVIGEVDPSLREFVIDNIEQYARKTELLSAISQSIDLVGKGDLEAAYAKIDKAKQVGVSTQGEFADFFEDVDQRTLMRRKMMIGDLKNKVVPTGIKALDASLLHKGLAAKELVVIAAGAKRGKSIALLNISANAALSGHKVLFVSLELGKDIIQARLDSYLTGIPMKEISQRCETVRQTVKEKIAKDLKEGGMLKIHEYPSGSMKPSDLQRLIEQYKSRGIEFDLIVVDYVSIMAPERRTENPRSDMEGLTLFLRGLASKENVAVLTAYQANREGQVAVRVKATHMAGDFSVVRHADLLLTISSTNEERRNDQCRLSLEASRNQAGIMILCEQDLARMNFFVKCEIGSDD